MYSSREEIKAELLENADQIRDNGGEDNLGDWVDGFCSPYYSDTLKDWVEMDDEHRDTWKELGYNANKNDGGILDLMAVDVWCFYDQLTREVWAEIEEEREESESD
jgi:DNA-binding ferritin-like protein (Dps family)